MKFERRLEVILGQQEFRVPDTPDDRCQFAKQYAEWTTEVIRNVEQQPTIVAVNQGIVLVTRQYFEWRVVVPKNHRNRIGEMGHQCIFSVFEEAFLKLKAIELSIQPPPVTVPAQPPAPPPPPPPVPLQIAGIFLGDEE